MGTVIYDKNGVHIKRFYGGEKRGMCYQISIPDKYIQLTQKEFNILSKRLDSYVTTEGYVIECYDDVGQPFDIILLSSKEPKVKGKPKSCVK